MKIYDIYLWVMSFLVICDYSLTLIGIKKGFEEGNPIIIFLMKDLDLYISLFIVMIISILLILLSYILIKFVLTHTNNKICINTIYLTMFIGVILRLLVVLSWIWLLLVYS